VKRQRIYERLRRRLAEFLGIPVDHSVCLMAPAARSSDVLSRNLHDVEQQGAGIDASLEGQQFQQRRLTSSTPNSGILDDTPLATLYASLERTTARKLIENGTFDLIVAIATMDNRPLELGDFLTATGYLSDGATWCFAQYRPIQETLLVRCERTATITRPESAGGRLSQQPMSGSTIATGYFGTSEGTEQVLTLSAGVYAFAEAGASAVSVPVGIQQTARVRDSSGPGGQLPTEIPVGQFVAYVPPLGDLRLQERDIIDVGWNHGRFQSARVLSTGTAGLIGYIAVCEAIPA